MKNFGIREANDTQMRPPRHLGNASIVRAEWRSGPERDLPAGASSFRYRSERVPASVEDRDADYADVASRDTSSARPVARDYHLPKRGSF